MVVMLKVSNLCALYTEAACMLRCLVLYTSGHVSDRKIAQFSDLDETLVKVTNDLLTASDSGLTSTLVLLDFTTEIRTHRRYQRFIKLRDFLTD